MYPIGNIEDFKFYMASEKDIKISEALIDNANKENADFLRKNPSDKKKMHITGSFIYAHPPDYKGRPMLKAGIDEWRDIFKGFKAMGMDTVIFQAALWSELQECYYNTKVFNDYKIWNVIEPMLEAAGIEHITVYLGGYGSVSGWNPDLKTEDVKREINFHLRCYEELMNWHEYFSGFYFTCETAFGGTRDRKREQILNYLYKELFRELKSIADEKIILMSPASKYFKGMDNEFLDAWNTMLENVPLDVLVPQDSIGTSANTLLKQEKIFKLWKNVAEQNNIELWGNIELFERQKFNHPDNFITASPERIIAQINNAAPFTKKLVCWEAMYFTSRELEKMQKIY